MYSTDNNSLINEYSEEIGDINSDFYQKKVVKEGPGFKSVTIVSKGGGQVAGIIPGIMADIFGGGGDMHHENETSE